MCVTVYKYLVWPGTFPKTTQVIPVTGTGKEGELQASGFEVKNNALKFPVVSKVPECSENLNGMIYYDSKSFKCCMWDKDKSKYTWFDCGGVSGGWPGNEFTAPVTIWRDANKTFKVLEISEQQK